MEALRNIDPYILQTIWNGICFFNSQNEDGEYEMIIHYIQQKINCASSQADVFLKQALNDKLINEFKENEVVYYKRVNEVENISTHDWYCIECHKAGIVIQCKLCSRVYHEKCLRKGRNKVVEYDLKKEIDSKTYDTSICSTCNLCRLTTDIFSDHDELNHLLGFLYERIKMWLPLNLSNSLSQEYQPKWLSENELNSRSELLFHDKITYPVIENKIFNKKYKRLFELLRDVELMHHNTAVFHGIDSQEFGAAMLMLADCAHDIKELMNCMDCYKFSNEKVNSKWFCTPCRVPHKLVWAKQKGYPYWPAKVMRETESGIDVRFFGGKYERSVLPANHIKPIDVDIYSLQLKESSALSKALDELRLHQKYLGSPYMVENIFRRSKKRRSSSERSNNSSRKSSRDHTDYSSEGGSSSSDLISPSKKIKKKSIELTPVKNNVVKEEPKPPKIENCTENNVKTETNGAGKAEFKLEPIEPQYNESVEKLKRKLEHCQDKNTLITIAMESMQGEIDRLKAEHTEKIKKLTESHEKQINDTKKKQWCFNCGEDALYHCCWNTSYCSQSCQQQHWQAEHKRVCRRKRT